MEKISKKQIARNLDKAIKHEVGEKGLQILIHGWLKYRKYGQKYYEAVRHRKWLFITEVIDLSDYAGYDLSKLEF